MWWLDPQLNLNSGLLSVSSFDLKISWEGSMILRRDKSIISIAHNPIQHDGTKHLKDSIISLSYVPTEDQLVDALTKGLHHSRLFILRELLLQNMIDHIRNGSCAIIRRRGAIKIVPVEPLPNILVRSSATAKLDLEYHRHEDHHAHPELDLSRRKRTRFRHN
ncbi:hypothetical protein V2J09_009011 [Rumex salicifolius]